MGANRLKKATENDNISLILGGRETERGIWEGERKGREKGGLVQIWRRWGRSTEGREFEEVCSSGEGGTGGSH